MPPFVWLLQIRDARSHDILRTPLHPPLLSSSLLTLCRPAEYKQVRASSENVWPSVVNHKATDTDSVSLRIWGSACCSTPRGAKITITALLIRIHFANLSNKWVVEKHHATRWVISTAICDSFMISTSCGAKFSLPVIKLYLLLMHLKWTRGLMHETRREKVVQT